MCSRKQHTDPAKDRPEAIVCDATFLGCRQDLLPTMDSTNQHTTTVALKGSVHRDRVFINNKKLRDLLEFSGIDRKIWKPSANLATDLSKKAFNSLLDKLEKTRHNGSGNFIDNVLDVKTSHNVQEFLLRNVS